MARVLCPRFFQPWTSLWCVHRRWSFTVKHVLTYFAVHFLRKWMFQIDERKNKLINFGWRRFVRDTALRSKSITYKKIIKKIGQFFILHQNIALLGWALLRNDHFSIDLVLYWPRATCLRPQTSCSVIDLVSFQGYKRHQVNFHFK